MGNQVSTQLSPVVQQLCQALDPREHPTRAAATAVSLLIAADVGKVFVSWLRDWRRKQELARRRQLKRAEQLTSLKLIEDKLKDSQNLEELKEVISKLTLLEVVGKLKTGELKPSDVLTVYQAKALEAHKATNCLVEPILEADRWASEADIHPQAPFYGLPISIKDHFGIAGYDSTIGCAKYACDPFKDDCVVVKALKKLGAVPFVKTNVPQTMLSWETDNPIYGRTVNPHDPKRTPGGSSGGEGALIASGGSLIGVGGDIGGSIRIPCCLCGIYGLKPTANRLSLRGCIRSVGDGQTVVQPSYGPMARDVDSLVFFMKNLLGSQMFNEDPSVPPLPFDSQAYEDKRPLRIGFYTQDGFIRAVPAMERAVLEVKSALERAGHTLIQWQPPGFEEQKGTYLFGKVMTGECAKHLGDMTKNDALTTSMQGIIFQARHPLLSKWVAHPILKLLGEEKFCFISKIFQGSKNVYEWWALAHEVESYRYLVTNDWKSKKLDAVICPGFTSPAMPVNTSIYATAAASYTYLYNVLNFPAGSVPVTKVTPQDENEMANYVARETMERTIKKGMVGSAGLPVNVQCVTLPWQDELCLRIMKEIETAVKN